MTEHEPLILAVADTLVPLACSVRALEAAIRKYLAITNEAPKPFGWTKTADEILANVARLCQRISNPGD